MRFRPQVRTGHYSSELYLSKARWISTWHQLDEIRRGGAARVLEVGPGPGVFAAVAAASGLKVDTLDFDPRVEPTVVASAIELPFRNRAYDSVCAFQVLEHLPYELAIQAFSELVRVTARRLIVSLPDAQAVWRFRMYAPLVGTREWLMSKPLASPQPHEFDGEHYWEVNKRGFSLNRVVQDFSRYATMERTYRVLENPYHRFFVFSPAT